MVDFRQQPNEALSGHPASVATLVAQFNGIWHVTAYASGTGGGTIQVIVNTPAPTATITADVAVPGTNAKTSVASASYHYEFPVIAGNTYTFSGVTIVSGVLLCA
jgi:hypothetical protein